MWALTNPCPSKTCVILPRTTVRIAQGKVPKKFTIISAPTSNWASPMCSPPPMFTCCKLGGEAPEDEGGEVQNVLPKPSSKKSKIFVPCLSLMLAHLINERLGARSARKFVRLWNNSRGSARPAAPEEMVIRDFVAAHRGWGEEENVFHWTDNPLNNRDGIVRELTELTHRIKFTFLHSGNLEGFERFGIGLLFWLQQIEHLDCPINKNMWMETMIC